MILPRSLYTVIFSAGLALLPLAAHAQSEAPKTFPVGELTFSRPAEWNWVTVNSSMRKAQLAVPGLDPSKAAEVAFFHFGAGGGGDIESNTKRWLGQFKGAPSSEKVESKQIGGRKVTLVSTEGTYSTGMPGASAAPMDNYALLGAIIEDAGGNVFVKMTGPKATVQANSAKFLEFLGSVKP
jgi:hypothetical protein